MHDVPSYMEMKEKAFFFRPYFQHSSRDRDGDAGADVHGDIYISLVHLLA